MNIRNCHSRKRCHVRCHINWVQDFHLMFYLDPYFLQVKSYKKMPILKLLKPHAYQAPEEVMMN